MRNLPVSSSVEIYFSCRRSAEIFPEHVCEENVKKREPKTHDFRSIIRGLYRAAQYLV